MKIITKVVWSSPMLGVLEEEPGGQYLKAESER